MKDASAALKRYARQIMLWGLESQNRLATSAVLVAGLGGLGSAAALYLAAAGVGRLILVDRERVEISNLNRQILHWTRDIDRLKVDSAAEKLRKLNPSVQLVRVKAAIESPEKVEGLVAAVDVVIDCLDNWRSRFVLNEACVRIGRPLVHAAVEGLTGHLTVVAPRKGPCLRCVFPNPRDKGSVPVAGPTPGVLGAMEALEALKLITGYGKPLIGRLLVYDGYAGSAEVCRVERRRGCPVCGSENR